MVGLKNKFYTLFQIFIVLRLKESQEYENKLGEGKGFVFHFHLISISFLN